MCLLLCLSEAWLFNNDKEVEEVDINADGQVTNTQAKAVNANFINKSPKDMDVYWDDGSYGQLVATKVDRNGGNIEISTFVGHLFHWTIHGRRQRVGDDVKILDTTNEYVLSSDVDISVDKSACQDRFPRCKVDAKNGECTRNPGMCLSLIKTTPKTKQFLSVKNIYMVYSPRICL